MIDWQDVYDRYLDSKIEEHRLKYKDFKGYFNASSAGKCYKQMYYRITDTDPQPIEIKSKRLLRLGTILHSDFESALNEYSNTVDKEYLEILTEHRIVLEVFKVIGHLDTAVINKHFNTMYLYDLKSISDWNYRMKAGRVANRRPTSPHYFMQLGTYAIGLQEQYKDFNFEEDSIQLKWYNKNDSRMTSEIVNTECIENARDYWQDLNDFVEEEGENILEIEPSTAIGIPFASWECNYCQFSKICIGE